MSLEVHRQPSAARGRRHPPPGGASLFGVEIVGDADLHDAIRPAGTGEGFPVRTLVEPPAASREALPERCMVPAGDLPARARFLNG